MSNLFLKIVCFNLQLKQYSARGARRPSANGSREPLLKAVATGKQCQLVPVSVAVHRSTILLFSHRNDYQHITLCK